MRKIAASAAIISLALLLLALPEQHEAQQAVPVPGGDALQAKADKVRESLFRGKPEEFLSQFAPWIQGRAALVHAEAPAKAKEAEQDLPADFKAKSAEQFKTKFRKEADPNDVLKLEKEEDILKLTAAQSFALFLGQYRLQGTRELKERIDGAWHLVDRHVGFEQFQDRSDFENAGANWLTRTRGRVVFMNAVHRDHVTVTCVAEGDAWQVVDLEFKLAEVRGGVSRTAVAGNWTPGLVFGSELEVARVEGEQMLGSFRNRVKVAFAKTASRPGTLTGEIDGGGCGVSERELSGKYFRVRDRVSGTKNYCKLMAEPTKEYPGSGFAVLEFFLSGERDKEDSITWYQTTAQVFKSHPGFKE